MQHVYWVLEGLLAGRPGPVVAPWSLAELAAGGFRAVVSLSDEVDPQETAQAGLRHYLFALLPILVLNEEQRQDVLAAVEAALPAIHAEINQGYAVLVHCHAGNDRTGVMLACYLVRYGCLGAVEAIARVRGLRPEAMSAIGYEEAVYDFAEREARVRDRKEPG